MMRVYGSCKAGKGKLQAASNLEKRTGEKAAHIRTNVTRPRYNGDLEGSYFARATDLRQLT